MFCLEFLVVVCVFLHGSSPLNGYPRSNGTIPRIPETNGGYLQQVNFSTGLPFIKGMVNALTCHGIDIIESEHVYVKLK